MERTDKTLRRRVAFLLSLAVLLGLCFAPAARAATEQNVAPAGDPMYLSMHKYITPTDLPNVYRVVESIEPPTIYMPALPVYVAIALDGSGSMSRFDIWDSNGEFDLSGVPKWINRYNAMHLAVEACIEALVDSGNPEVYISLRAHNSGNKVTPGVGDPMHFEKIYDGSGNLKTKFQRTIGGVANPSWIMVGWNGWGGSNDFGLAYRTIHGEFKNDIVSGNIPEDSSRFVLVMGDGDDTSGTSGSPNNTQQVAMALKAPLDANYKTGLTAAAVQVAGLPQGTYGGLGATIWTVTMGSDISHNTTWETDLMAANYAQLWDYPTGAPSAGLIRGGYDGSIIPRYKLAEIWAMVGSMELSSYPATDLGVGIYGENYIDHYRANIGAIDNSAEGNTHFYSCFKTDVGDPSAANVAANAVYVGRMFPPNQGAESGGSNAVYDTLTSPVKGVFADFATSATSQGGGGTGITILDKINSSVFRLYQYPGEPMLKYETNDPDPTIVHSETHRGNNITWAMTHVNGGHYYSLTYYIYCEADSATDLFYATSNDAYITYTNEDLDIVVKNFPVVYINPSSSAVQGNTGLPDGSGSGSGGSGSGGTTGTGGAESADGGSSLQPLYAIPYGGGAATVYTPSVTAGQNLADVSKEGLNEGDGDLIEQENVSDGTEEQMVANTSTTAVMLLTVLGVIGLAAIVIRCRRLAGRR